MQKGSPDRTEPEMLWILQDTQNVACSCAIIKSVAERLVFRFYDSGRN